MSATSANAGPDQARCTQGDSTDFPLQGVATAGMQPIASTTWSVIAGLATIDFPSSLQTTAADTEAVVIVNALAAMKRAFAKAFMLTSIYSESA